MTTRRPLPARFSPRPVRTFRERFVRSGFYADLRQDGHLIAAYALILFCALLVALLTRGQVVTWDGVYEVPTAPSCGSYCGTDAGLLPSE